MKRCLAMILTCALLLTVCPLEGLAAELEQKKQEAEADYIEQPIGEVEFQEEAPSPNQPEEPEEAPPEEPKAEPTTPEHEEVPKENAVQVQSTDTYTEGDYTYTVADGAATITKYTGSAMTLTIPETLGGYVVQKISDSAFAYCESLKDVKLPKNLTTLGYHAFQRCNGLTSIEIPRSLTSASSPFYECKNLNDVHFETGTTKVIRTLFSGCTGLEAITLPNTITEIEWSVFSGCSNLSSVQIPDSVTKIDDTAFAYCEGLKDVKLPKNLTTLGYHVFQGCNGLTSIEIPQSLTSVSSPFYECKNLNDVHFETGTTKVIRTLFSGCTGLEAITLPNTITEIEWSVFSGCSNLSSVQIPDSVTKIDDTAFAYCEGLKDVKLPKNLTTLGYHVFQGCNGLTSIEIPRSLTKASSPFAECKNLSDIRFESGTTKVTDSLFYECPGLKIITLPDTVTEIGRYALARCVNLSKVLIPTSVKNFEDNIFLDTNRVTIYCDYNSYATLYAISNKIPFQASGGFVGSEDSILNWNNSRYYADTNGISSNGYINMSVNYQVKDAWKDQVHDLIVKVNLPSTAELSEKTIRVDGVLCTNYTYNEKENTLNVPVTAKSGKVSFSVKKTSSGNLTSYVQFFFQRQNGWERDLLGIVNEPVKELTLHVSDTVGTPEVKVSGLAPASRQVDLYVDGKLSRSLQANKAGFYEGEVTLNDPENYTSYQITAKCKNDASELSVSSEVMYQNEIPEMTGLKVKYNEHQVIKEQDLMNTNGKKPQIYFVPGTRFDFEATFSHPDVIDKVYVTSTRNNETKKLELVYDASKNAFCSSGYFDKNNRNYVPGTIGVEYSIKREEMSLDHQWDWNSLYDQLDESVRENSKVTKVKDTDTEKVFQIDLEDDVGNILEKGIEVGLKVLDDKDGTLFNEIDGMYSYGDLFGLLQDGDNFLSYVVPGYDKDKFFLTLDYKDPETISMIAYDTANSTFLELWFKAKNLDQVAEGLQAIKGPSKMIYKTYGIIGDYDDWVDQIYSNPNIADKVAAEQTAYDLKNARMMTLFISVVVPMCIMSGGATVPALLASGSVAIFGALADMMLKLGAGYLFWGEYGVKWVVDPSGYVYDAETHQRLEGVTVTAYGVEDDKSESFWTKPPASSPETLWDASQYNQSNPLLTNKDGKYAWNVPTGWWRVKYEKEGYITAWSDWLPVPPPQTEVNVGLQSQETKDFSIYLQDLEKQELTNGQLDLRFTLTNRTKQDKTVQFYVGAYTKEGKLLDGKLLSTTVNADSEREEPISLRLPEGTGISDLILKAFTLTDGTIVPMRKAWEYIYS